MELRTIGLTEEQGELAEMARAFVQRAQIVDGPIDERAGALQRGELPPSWQDVVDNGLHVTHLSEDNDGAGGSPADMAVVIEQFAGALYCGPLVPTAIAGALLEMTGLTNELKRIVAGEPAAAIIAPGFVAEPVGDELRISGTCDAVLGAPFATQFVVRADRADGQTVWVVVDREADGIHVVLGESFDVTQPVAEVRFDGVRVPAGCVTWNLSAEKGERIAQAFCAADALGIAAATTTLGVEHALLRTQFRRKLAEFQSMQHRLAGMYVREEEARAVAWDIGRDLNESSTLDAQVIRVSTLIVLQHAVANAYDFVLTLGAMGFTWEHPAHLLWRRATQLLTLAGPAALREVELGRLAMDEQRTIRVVDPDAHPELREEVREVLRTAGDPTEGVIPGSAWAPRRGSAWQRNLAEHKLVSPQLPEPYGRGASVAEQAVILEEFGRAGLQPPTLVIGDWVVPTILEHGTPEQRERFIPPSLASDIMWCQLFSEPGAGSDLGSIATRAEKVAGGWKVNGQKIWNTLADEADWGALLLRTDPETTGSRGLSYLIVDMRAPGLHVVPIKQATGQAEFCEVFFDDVFVPDEFLLGEVGQGWKIATTTLANERLRMGEELGHGSTRRFRELVEGATTYLREPALAALGRAVARESALAAMSARGAIRRIGGGSTTNEASVQKLVNIYAQEAGSLDLVKLSGPAAVRETEITASDPYGDLLDYLGLPAIVFGGGTPDIQLTVIAKRVLGL